VPSGLLGALSDVVDRAFNRFWDYSVDSLGEIVMRVRNSGTRHELERLCESRSLEGQVCQVRKTPTEGELDALADKKREAKHPAPKSIGNSGGSGKEEPPPQRKPIEFTPERRTLLIERTNAELVRRASGSGSVAGEGEAVQVEVARATVGEFCTDLTMRRTRMISERVFAFALLCGVRPVSRRGRGSGLERPVRGRAAREWAVCPVAGGI
jgi:hypothetical protein